ncbi:MAG: winged helix DNA-binding protein, partial [Bacteroidota bacterium]
ESSQPSTMTDFAEWLNDKHAQSASRELPQAIEQEIKQESLNNTVARHFGMLVQVSNVWTKLTFKETPFQGFEDYGITQFILHTGTPTKSMATEWSTLERSTAFEVIRRLQKLGLIEEFPDQNDRRTKRIKITQVGTAALKQADVKVDQISNLLVGDLTEKKKIDLLKLLLKLNKFHLTQYAKGVEEVERQWFSNNFLEKD